MPGQSRLLALLLNSFLLAFVGEAAVAAPEAVGGSQQIEYGLKAGQVAACLKNPEAVDFLQQVEAWKGVVPELVISHSPKARGCAEQMQKKLQAKGFRVFLKNDPSERGLRARGAVSVAAGAGSGPVPAAGAGAGAGAGGSPSGVADAKTDEKAEAKPDTKNDAKWEGAKPEEAVPAPVVVGAPTESAPVPTVVESPQVVGSPTESARVEAVPEAVPSEGFAKPIKLEPPKPTDEHSRWVMGFEPSYLKVSGSGIPENSTGLNPLRILLVHHYDTIFDLRFNWTSSIGSAQALPEMMVLTGDVAYTLIGARQTFKLKEPAAPYTVQAIGGGLYLSQNPSGGSVASYRQGSVVLNELVTFYVGVRGVKNFSPTTSLVGEVALIPVLPLMNNKMTVGQKLKFGPEYCSDQQCWSVSMENAEYSVSYNDETLGDLSSTHSMVVLGFTFEFF